MKYQFVDKILSLNPGRTIHGQYTWPENLEIFKDHFPGFPVVPGVLITEMMGQTAALCIESKLDDPVAPMLIQIKNATFRDWINPSVCLDIYAEILSFQKKMARAKTRTLIGDKEIASSELLFTFETKDKLGLPKENPLLIKYSRLNK